MYSPPLMSVLYLAFETNERANRLQKLQKSGAHIVVSEPRWPGFFELAKREKPYAIAIDFSQAPSHALETADYMSKARETKDAALFLLRVPADRLEAIRKRLPQATPVTENELSGRLAQMEQEAEARARQKKEAAAAAKKAARAAARAAADKGKPAPAAKAKPAPKAKPAAAPAPLPLRRRRRRRRPPRRAKRSPRRKSSRGEDRMPTGFTREELQPYARATRAEYEGVLQKIVEIPSVSVEPERKPDVRRAAEYAATLLRVVRRTGEDLRDEGPPDRARPVRRRSEVPDGHRLQPPRRSAGGRARLEDPALRVHAGRRPLLRPRHDRRQGPGDHGALRRAVRPRARSAGQHPLPLGARGGDRQPPLRDGDPRPREGLRDGLGRRLRHGLGLARPPGRAGGAARPAGLPLRPPDGPDRPALRHRRRRGAQPGDRALLR